MAGFSGILDIGRFFRSLDDERPINFLKVFFTETLFLKYSSLTKFELSSQQVNMSPTSCHNRYAIESARPCKL